METQTIGTDQSTRKSLQDVDFNNLEFGRIATDHMFIANYKEGCWFDSGIIPFGTMQISPFTAALHYGQTVFEGMKAYRLANGDISIFRPLDHADRFNRSLERMCMPQVPVDLFMDALDTLIRMDSDWVSSIEGTSLYIRPFMFATDDKIGVQVSHNYRFMVVCSPVGKYYSKLLKVKVERKYARAFRGGTGSAKCGGNYGVSFYPYQQAVREGFDQILWTDAASHEFIEESGTMNVGFIIDKRFITPRVGETILAGVTRDSILKIASKNGLTIEERHVDYHEIISSIEDGKKVEAFGIGTAATVAPINEIGVDGKTYSTYTEPDAVMFKLKKTLEDIRTGKHPDRWKWNWVVK